MTALANFRPRLCKVLSTTIQGEVQRLSFTDEKLETLKPGDPGVKPFKYIPGPKAYPFIGSFWRYHTGEYSHDKLHKTYIRFYKEFGPIVKENLFVGNTLVHLFDPRDIEAVYKMESKYHPIRKSHRALLKYRTKRKDLYERSGLAPSNGEDWKNFRRIFPSNITKEDGIDDYASSLEIVANDLVAKIKSSLDRNGEVELLPMLYDWAFESMGVVALGKRFGSLHKLRVDKLNRFISAVHDTHYSIYKTETTPFGLFGKHYRTLTISQDYMAFFLKRYVDKAFDLWLMAENGGELLVDENQPIRMNNSLIWQFLELGMNEPDILTTIIDMFQGGIHSTANTLAFALYHLALHQDKQLALGRALMAALPNKTDSVYKLPEKIPYCKQVIYETLRLNPPAIGTGRVVQENIVLGGYLVPKNSTCILHHQVAQMQEENFERPEIFLPERHEKSPWSSNQFAFRPFTYGPRRCFGMGIALLELYMAVAKILREFQIEYRYEKVDTVNYLNNEPDKGIKMSFKPLSK